mmetsp:Transcript_40356/g.104428  ORF Transcript_40356/g.104428 Transcript_40356/m.104428 type:complete len:420 (+) Transcript_40356:256-1515(+)
MSDTLNETAYLAEQASLHVRASSQSYGLDVYVGGFHHKLPLLLEAGLKEFLAFGDARSWERRASDTAFCARLAAQREALLRGYRNAYLRPGDHCADMRRLLIMPHKHSAPDRAKALEAIDVAALAKFAQELLPKLRAEVLVSGNATVDDVEALVKGLPACLREGAEGQKLEDLPRHPKLFVAILPSGPPTLWLEDCPDAGNRNAAVEMYWQLENTSDHRAKVVVDLLEALMSEPLFDTLRTKQQLGYVASCGTRYTQGVMGFSIWLLSSKVGPAEICRRVEAFLVDFRKKVAEEIPDDDIERHVASLAAHKLEPDRTMISVQEGIWGELQDRKRVFDRSLAEAVALAGVTRADVLKVLDVHFARAAPDRRLMIVASIGGKAKAKKAEELKALQKDYPGAKAVGSQAEFFATTKFFDNTM